MAEGKTDYGFKNEGKSKKTNPYPRKMINGIRKKEHRRVMEENLGRSLESWEHVHHINGDQKDNRLENLQVLTASEHMKIHKKKD